MSRLVVQEADVRRSIRQAGQVDRTETGAGICRNLAPELLDWNRVGQACATIAGIWRALRPSSPPAPFDDKPLGF